MKLNNLQKYALMAWLGTKLPSLYKDHSVICSFDDFCDGNISEWRVISTFGMAGKIWNNEMDDIYITGYSHGELSKRKYNKQQKLIEQWNKELRELIKTYS